MWDRMRGLVDRLAEMKLSWASMAVCLIGSLYLMAGGLMHIVSADAALFADLLSWIDVAVAASPEMSLSGILWLFSVLIGLNLIVIGAGLGYCFLVNVFDW